MRGDRQLINSTDYSPFHKSIDQLDLIDLAALRKTKEGWYCEYKSELSKPSDIAKSISSFANTYGGWIFYGVAQSDDGENTAGSFPGLHAASREKCTASIAQSLRDNVNPTPYFEVQTLSGPCEVIGLGKDRIVVAVWVPSSLHAPHVHKRGCIFRRVADQSDPAPETDRHVLDQLWARSTQHTARIREVVSQPSNTDRLEDGGSYLDIHLLPRFIWQQAPQERISFTEFKTLMTCPGPISKGGGLYNSFATFDNGYIAKNMIT